MDNLRPCFVNGRKAFFHQWVEESEIVSPSFMIGGHQGGVVRSTLGLIEYEDGTVAKYYPEKIRFLDRKDQSD